LLTLPTRNQGSKFILINLRDDPTQLILQIDEAKLAEPAMAKEALAVYPAEDVPVGLNLENEFIFFTTLDKQRMTLSGYQIKANWEPSKVWQVTLGDSDSEEILSVST
jgi:hypothetical protein